MRDHIREVSLQDETEKRYLNYALSVITSRALPDVRDGLKPVQRRILYSMYHDLKLVPSAKYKKSATIVGSTMGKLHPHGDQAIYDAMVRMAQEFSLLHPLVEGYGNFGSIDGDKAAAMRYCVTGDTRVHTPTGDLPIEQIVDAAPNTTTPIDIQVLDRLGEPVSASRFFHSGHHPSLRIDAAEGFSLSGSNNHPVLCLVEVMGVPMLLWKLMAEIKPGDWVALSPRDPKPVDGFIPYLARYVRSEEPSAWLHDHTIDSAQLWLREREKILLEIQSEEVKSVILPLVDAGYTYTQVTDVVELGEQPVYSLRVDSECHSFLTNGFVSHNTEARLQPISVELLDELKQKTVDMRPNFDGTLDEPVVLPAKYPNLLVNGSAGIAVGMATNIPPHNLGEVMDGLLLLLDQPDATVADLLKRIKGPDFPTGGELISSRKERVALYQKGQGNLMIRGEWKEERIRTKDKKVGRRVVITSTPYGVNRSSVVEKIADVILDKKLPPLLDVRDESTEQTRIVLELKAKSDPEMVMAYLFKHTPLQSRFSVNLTCLVPTPNPLVAAPERLSLKQMLEQFLAFRLEVLDRRFRFELEKLLKRIHILEGFAIVFNALDEAIRIIRESDGRKDSHEKLKARFELTDIQTEAILDTRLYRLAKLEIQDILHELDTLREKAAEIEGILASREKMNAVLRSECEEIRGAFENKRKTRVREGDKSPELDEDTFIQEEDTHVILTRDGWVKRIRKVNLDKIRLRENDSILAVLPGSTKESVCFFTNYGVAYTARINDIPQTTGYGDPLQSLFKFKDGEKVIAGASLDPRICGDIGLSAEAEQEDGPEPPKKTGNIVFLNSEAPEKPKAEEPGLPATHLLAVSQGGSGSRISLATFAEPSNKAGRRFCRLARGDQVIGAFLVSGEEDLILLSEKKRYLLFDVGQVKFLSGPGKGVGLMKLDDDDLLFAAEVCYGPEDALLIETDDDAIIELSPGNLKRGKRLTKGTRKKGLKEIKGVSYGAIRVPSLKDDDEELEPEPELPEEDEGSPGETLELPL